MGYNWQLIISCQLDIRSPFRIVLPLLLVRRDGSEKLYHKDGTLEKIKLTKMEVLQNCRFPRRWNLTKNW